MPKGTHVPVEKMLKCHKICGGARCCVGSCSLCIAILVDSERGTLVFFSLFFFLLS